MSEVKTCLPLLTSEQLLAYESILQFAPKSSWAHMHMLAEHGDPISIEALFPLVPALARVARLEQCVYRQAGGITAELKDVTAFVLEKAQQVRSSLSNHPVEDAPLASNANEDWREVR